MSRRRYALTPPSKTKQRPTYAEQLAKLMADSRDALQYMHESYYNAKYYLWLIRTNKIKYQPTIDRLIEMSRRSRSHARWYREEYKKSSIQLNDMLKRYLKKSQEVTNAEV